jgi:chromosome segregation ATPase
MEFMRSLFVTSGAMAILLACCGCSAFARRERSADQIAAEAALLGKKSTLLERENQVLREENLALVRDLELQRSEQQKMQAEFAAERERLTARIKSAEGTISNLNEKIAILESESGEKIRQLVALNEQLAKKSSDELRKLQEELARTQVDAAQDKEKLARENAEKQFALGKEIQELKQRLAEKAKETDELRDRVNALRASEAQLVQQLNDLRQKLGRPPGTP